MKSKSLERRLANIRSGDSDEFILACAKDADMAFGLAAPGPAVNGRHPSLQDYRQSIRAIVSQEIVDIAIMSASTNEKLALQERLFDGTSVTPCARANDTTDIWVFEHGDYSSAPSLPFRTATIDHIQCGKLECSSEERAAGTGLGLYSMTFNNVVEHDARTLAAFGAFRLEAEQKGFRYILEVFAPNVANAVAPENVGRFLNGLIARSLAGVTEAGRPIFLKIPYCGARDLEELVAYDSSLIVGILGGRSGTTYDSFKLLSDAKKHGARAALFGRMINHAEDQLLFIECLRRVADGEVSAEEAVKVYHDGLGKRGVKAFRALEADMELTVSA